MNKLNIDALIDKFAGEKFRRKQFRFFSPKINVLPLVSPNRWTCMKNNILL